MDIDVGSSCKGCGFLWGQGTMCWKMEVSKEWFGKLPVK